jgi:hypothetical protein
MQGKSPKTNIQQIPLPFPSLNQGKLQCYPKFREAFSFLSLFPSIDLQEYLNGIGRIREVIVECI